MSGIEQYRMGDWKFNLDGDQKRRLLKGEIVRLGSGDEIMLTRKSNPLLVESKVILSDKSADKMKAEIAAMFRVPVGLSVATHENKRWRLRLYFRYFMARNVVRRALRTAIAIARGGGESAK